MKLSKTHDAILMNGEEGILEVASFNTSYKLESPSNVKVSRTLTLKNTEENKDFYGQVRGHVGKTLCLESDQINGYFNIGIDGEDIVLREML